MESVFNKHKIEKDGYIFFRNGEIESIVIDPKRLENIIMYIKNHNIKNVMINPSIIGEDLANLDFINKIASIERLSILQKNLILSPINNLHELRSLSFEYNIKDKIDLSNFPKLEYIGYSDNAKIINLDKCINLKYINIHGFKDNNLLSFEFMQKLEEIFLYRSHIKNFIGIEKLQKLKFVDLDNAPKLESLDGLNLNLLKLRIYNAKNLSNYNNLKNLENLENLIIQRAQDIPSIKFLKNFKKIKRIIFGGMNILDGDFSPLKDIPETFVMKSPYNTMK